MKCLRVYEYYQNNGQLLLKQDYKNGKKDGFAQGNYPTGEIGTTLYYEDCQLHGHFTLFYKNGQIKRKANYTAGYEDGLQTTFDPDGRATKQCFRTGEELDMSNG